MVLIARPLDAAPKCCLKAVNVKAKIFIAEKAGLSIITVLQNVTRYTLEIKPRFSGHLYSPLLPFCNKFRLRPVYLLRPFLDMLAMIHSVSDHATSYG